MKTKTIQLLKLLIICLFLIFTNCERDELIKVTKIQTGIITDKTATTAKASLTFIDLSGNVSEFGHCWGTESNPLITGSKFVISATPVKDIEFFSNLSGLNGETHYYVRAYAIDGGKTIYGSNVEFTTPQAPQIFVTAPVATDHWVGNTIHEIAWTDNLAENVIIKLYKGGVFQKDILQSPGTDGNLQSWTIPGDLIYAKNYTIRVFSLDHSVFGESQQFTISEPTGTTGTLSDIHANSYNTIKIGKQWWMAQNLNVTRYANGDELVNGATAGNINGDLTTQYYFAYANNNTNTNTYGRLYTWAAIMNGENSSNNVPSGVQGVCPNGWHVPSDAEWQELESFIGLPADQVNNTGPRGTIEGGKLKQSGITLWLTPNTGATNETGFNAIPAGSRFYDGNFYELTTSTIFWTSTLNGNEAFIRLLDHEQSTIDRHSNNRAYGHSVRCVKN